MQILRMGNNRWPTQIQIWLPEGKKKEEQMKRSRKRKWKNGKAEEEEEQ